MILTNPLLAVIGVFVALLLLLGQWRRARRRRVLAEALGGRSAGARLSRGNLYRPPFERMALLGLAALGLGTAAAEPVRPEVEPEPPPAPEVHSIVFAIDISASMQATDASPNRLGAAVRIASDLIEALAQDRIGLVLVAGDPYALAPPTRDHGVLRFILGGVTPTIASAHDPGSIPSQGLREAAALLTADGEPEGRRTIVFLGDGEAGESDADLTAAIGEIAGLGITVHAIGLGTPAGSGMTMPTAPFQLGGRIMTESGAPAVTRFREPTVSRIAAAGGGRYAHADDPAALGDLERALESPPPEAAASPESTESFVTRLEPTVWLIAFGLTLLLVESAMDVRLPSLGAIARRRA